MARFVSRLKKSHLAWLKNSNWSDWRKWWMDIAKALIIALLSLVLFKDQLVIVIAEATTAIKSIAESLANNREIEAIRVAEHNAVQITEDVRNYASIYFFGNGQAEDRSEFQSYSGYLPDLIRVKRILQTEIPQHAEYIDDAFDPLACVIRIKPGQSHLEYAIKHAKECGYDHSRDEYLSTGVINKLIIGLQNGDYDGPENSEARTAFGNQVLEDLNQARSSLLADLNALAKTIANEHDWSENTP